MLCTCHKQLHNLQILIPHQNAESLQKHVSDVTEKIKNIMSENFEKIKKGYLTSTLLPDSTNSLFLTYTVLEVHFINSQVLESTNMLMNLCNIFDKGDTIVPVQVWIDGKYIHTFRNSNKWNRKKTTQNLEIGL